jgi:DNA-binding transcriptional LysR family regulator
MHIHSLEEQLGNVRLFRRVGQRMVPTHAGEELLAAARELVLLSERAEQNIRALRGQVIGRVIIGCTPGSGEHFLPALLALFRLQYPEVALEVRVAPGDILLEELADQQIALLLFEEQQKRRGWESFLLGTETLTLLAPPRHPATSQGEMTTGMLREHSLVLPYHDTPLYRTIEEGLRRRGVNFAELHVPIETTSTTMMLQSVHDGLGLAFLPTLCIPREHGLSTIDMAGEPLQQEWYIIRVRNRSAPRAIQELYTFLTGSTVLSLLARRGIHTPRA